MKKNYESPYVEVVTFADVIITSPSEVMPGNPSGGDTPGNSGQ